MVTEVSKGRDTTVPCFCGLSTDSKPTDAGNGAEFKEIDTGDTYYYNEAGSTWVKWTGGSGGGGGDFSTANITLNLTPPEGVTLTQYAVSKATIDFPHIEDWYGYSSEDIVVENSNVVAVLTYQNQAAIRSGVWGSDGDIIYSMSGDPVCTGGVSYDAENNLFIVTGDGTITATVAE